MTPGEDPDHVVVSGKQNRTVFHDPDPENPDQPACDPPHDIENPQRRDPSTLGDGYRYCAWCDPNEDPQGRREGEKLATRLRREAAEERGEEVDPTLLCDGGADLPTPSDWPYAAVVHGADLRRDCLALTGDGSTCSNQAYRGEHLCGIHQQANDPDVLEGAHQWARIVDGDLTIAVCVRCEVVWHGGTPALAVDCPECGASVGQRCKDETDSAGVAAPLPPHAERRRRGRDLVDEYDHCPESPIPPVDDGQTRLADGGHLPGAQPGAAPSPVDRGGRDWVCPGCNTAYHGRPDVVDDAGARWRCYCSIACYVEDLQFLGAELHKCDLCDQVFDDVDALVEHDCDPSVEKLLADGGVTRQRRRLRRCDADSARQQAGVADQGRCPHGNRDCSNGGDGDLPCLDCFVEGGDR